MEMIKRLHIHSDDLATYHKKCGGLCCLKTVCVGDPHETYVNVSDVERAYGLLWMVLGDDKRVHDARRILLDLIGDREGQRRGIEFAKTKYKMRDVMSVLHKLP